MLTRTVVQLYTCTTERSTIVVSYGWAMLHPARKLFFNLFLTIVSATIAILVAVVEVLGCVEVELNGTRRYNGQWQWQLLYSAEHTYILRLASIMSMLERGHWWRASLPSSPYRPFTLSQND